MYFVLLLPEDMYVFLECFSADRSATAKGKAFIIVELDRLHGC